VVAEGPWIELAYLLPNYVVSRIVEGSTFPEVARLLRFKNREGSDGPSTSFDLVIPKKVAHRNSAF